MDDESEEKIKETRIDFNEQTDDSFPESRPRKSLAISNSAFRPLRLGSVLQTWTDVSRINYISTFTFSDIRRESRLISFNVLPKNFTNIDFDTVTLDSKNYDTTISESFLVNVTSLLNEDQLWGCFYNFPCLYEDAYSPVVRIRNVEDVAELKTGVLTRDMVAACLSYLKRTPILGDYVYIKLDLSSKYLTNIDVLQHYKYIVYLDLSSNLLTDLKVLSNLLYLQYISVNYNRLKTVLDYETPQWFLTEVHYGYNSVLTVRDLSALWSIAVLDLSHNNIKEISGLQNLRYLRHLDLSFNDIQRLENLNHLRLLWLDVSYNNLSSFEFASDAGLWTLLHLEYLNLDENNLTSMKIFSGCTRIRELHAKNNRFSVLMELAVYMQGLRRLMLLDFRYNPVCDVPGYTDVVINTFPTLLNLDSRDLDPVEKRISMMRMSPDMTVFSGRRLLRLLYVQQLSRSRVSPHAPPADTTDVPIVVLVGYEAVGKGSLARRLATECSGKVELALQHTTASHHHPTHYKVTTRRGFDDMLLAGDFLTYSEMDAESYGLSREEAFVKDGRVKLVTMDLLGALMLKLRGYRPILILANYLDKRKLAHRQRERKEARDSAHENETSMDSPTEISALQVLLSGRIIIKGILNEILQLLPDVKKRSEFVLDSECSLMMDSEARRNIDFKGIDRIAMSISSSTLLEDNSDLTISKGSIIDSGLHSLYKEPPGVDVVSNVCELDSHQERHHEKKRPTHRSVPNKLDQRNVPARKSVDFSRSSTWKGFGMADTSSRKSSKSVTFTSPDTMFVDHVPSTSGMVIEPKIDTEMENLLMKSISAKAAWPLTDADARPQDSDLWLAFLIQNDLPVTSETRASCGEKRRSSKIDNPNTINQLDSYKEIPSESFSTNIKDDYEDIHRNNPGLFCDTLVTKLQNNPAGRFKGLRQLLQLFITLSAKVKIAHAMVTMDNPEAAFKKMKALIKNIVNSQQDLKPMMEIDFADMKNCPIIKKKLANICSQIAPQRLFY